MLCFGPEILVYWLNQAVVLNIHSELFLQILRIWERQVQQMRETIEVADW